VRKTKKIVNDNYFSKIYLDLTKLNTDIFSVETGKCFVGCFLKSYFYNKNTIKTKIKINLNVYQCKQPELVYKNPQKL
jgi:hypothetical protein